MLNDMKKFLYKTKAVVFAISLILIFSSCADGISGLFGVDNADYSNESAIKTHETESEISQQLESVCSVLTFGTGDIVCFSSFKDVWQQYSDTVLCYLAGTYFEKYSADDEMFTLLAENYPELSVNTLIPASDFENTVYRLFGGSTHMKHKSTSRFSYLDKISAYISTGKTAAEYTDVRILSLVETQNTYRAVVRFSQNGFAFPSDYSIIFRKRADGEIPYIYSVNESESVTADT